MGGGPLLRDKKENKKDRTKKQEKAGKKQEKRKKNIMEKDKKIKRKEALSPGAFTEHCLAVCCSTLHCTSSPKGQHDQYPESKVAHKKY